MNQNLLHHIWTLVAPHAPPRTPEPERPDWSYPGPALLAEIRAAREEMVVVLDARKAVACA